VARQAAAEDQGPLTRLSAEGGARCFIAFTRDNGSVYHTYTVSAPDPFVAPYHFFLLERTPKLQAEPFRAWRKDEYPD
jgi:hypothetical protein